MNTLRSNIQNHPLAWTLASALLILIAAIALIWAVYPAASGSPVHNPGSLQENSAAQPTLLQPGCQSLPECDYIRAHSIDQSSVGSGPVGPMMAPVLTPDCDQLAECAYIRAHIQAEEGSQP
jgi:hypothetical protein